MTCFQPRCVRKAKPTNPWIRRRRQPFNDLRRYKTWQYLHERLVAEQTIRVQQLAPTHQQAARLYRFLANAQVSHGELIRMNCHIEAEVLAGRHVLILGDSTSFNLSKVAGRIKDKAAFGVLNDNQTLGFHSHVNVVVDAEQETLLGLGDVLHWVRPKKSRAQTTSDARSWSQKESYRWALGARHAQAVAQAARRRTFLFDSEADDFTLFDDLQRNVAADFIIRANHNRKISWQDQVLTLDELLGKLPAQDTYEVALPALDHYSWTSGKRVRRQARQATIEVRFQAVELLPPHSAEATTPLPLYVVEAREVTPDLPHTQAPIVWRLWTPHSGEDVEQARLIIHYYTLRWIIEQLFRTVKKQGFNLEATQLGTSDAILRQATMAIKAACTVLQLVYARNRCDTPPIETVFNPQEQQRLHQLNEHLQGKTDKQKNHFPAHQLSWAAWIIARLGGWKGYQSQKPPGPLTMKRGLDKFYSYLEALALFDPP